MKRVAIFGGSGKVGQKVIQRLISKGYEVTSFERKKRASIYGEEKIEVDFNNLETQSYNGDIVIVTIGTTQAKAGSEKAFVAVDYDLVLRIGNWAKKQGVKEFHVVSSVGAKENAIGVYLKTKWKMEQSISQLGFKKLFIYRPSLYADLDRRPIRINEVAVIPFLALFASFTETTLKYRPINTDIVADKIVNSVDSNSEGETIFEGDAIYSVAGIPSEKYRKKEQKLSITGITSILLVWGIIEAIGFSSLYVKSLVMFISMTLLVIWIKSTNTNKKGILNNEVKLKKTKNNLRYLIWLELVVILGSLLFAYISIAVIICTLLVFNILFFYNVEDYLNYIK